MYPWISVVGLCIAILSLLMQELGKHLNDSSFDLIVTLGKLLCELPYDKRLAVYDAIQHHDLFKKHSGVIWALFTPSDLEKKEFFQKRITPKLALMLKHRQGLFYRLQLWLFLRRVLRHIQQYQLPSVSP